MKSQSVVTDLRRKIFTAVAKVAYDSENPASDLEEIPFIITPDEVPVSYTHLTLPTILLV